MAALPSALACQVPSPARVDSPLVWIAKSISVVVPPCAAARVPVSKSSDEFVPPNGMSRWVCGSMPPGMTSLAVASITSSAAMSRLLPIVATVSPSMKTSAL